VVDSSGLSLYRAPIFMQHREEALQQLCIGGCQSRDAKPWWSSVYSLGPGSATAHARLGLCVAVPT
jgi:hypothetical protein